MLTCPPSPVKHQQQQQQHQSPSTTTAPTTLKMVGEHEFSRRPSWKETKSVSWHAPHGLRKKQEWGRCIPLFIDLVLGGLVGWFSLLLLLWQPLKWLQMAVFCRKSQIGYMLWWTCKEEKEAFLNEEPTTKLSPRYLPISLCSHLGTLRTRSRDENVPNRFTYVCGWAHKSRTFVSRHTHKNLKPPSLSGGPTLCSLGLSCHLSTF